MWVEYWLCCEGTEGASPSGREVGRLRFCGVVVGIVERVDRFDGWGGGMDICEGTERGFVGVYIDAVAEAVVVGAVGTAPG